MKDLLERKSVHGREQPVVLVVDDEAAVLASARRLIRRSHPDWTVLMAKSVDEAVDQLQTCSPWVVIADKLMPGREGTGLLEQVRQSHPQALRVMLTGDTSTSALLEGAAAAHLMFAKPYDPEAIAAILDRGACIRRLPINAEVKHAIGSLNQLPVVSTTFTQLSLELSRDEVSLERVVELVEADQALTARLLQLANSAFFGFSTEAVSIREAVVRLGSELIRAIVLALELFHPNQDVQTECTQTRRFGLARKVAERALKLGRELGLERHERDRVFVAGLLHNIGTLVELELSTFHCANTEESAIGAYLLTLWGFNNEQVRLVLHMRFPSRASQADRALAVLHLAWIQETEALHAELLDRAFLSGVGLQLNVDGGLEPVG